MKHFSLRRHGTVVVALLALAPWSLPAAEGLAAKAPVAGAQFRGATPLQWSQRMAKSEMARGGPELTYGSTRRSPWDYTTGLFAWSLVQLGDHAKDDSYRTFGEHFISSLIAPDGSIRGYKLEEYNIDQVLPGRVVLTMYERTKEPRLLEAARWLRRQLQTQPRTSDGGFWHKNRYPHQMWLDGLYMGSPFYAQYAKLFGEPAAMDDVVKQILLMDEHAYDKDQGLHYHAWDEQHAQTWANKQTGTSPHFWGRAEGWYAMAIVDCLGFIDVSHPELDAVTNVLRRVADGIARYQDPQTGLWWQILDQGERKGNYREATASAMFVYALAKGVNKGYLPRDVFLPVIRKGYEGIVRDLVRVDANGSVNLLQCCSVAGLGYTTTVNGVTRPRDGTFDYYVAEPVVENDLKGVGPFILAGLELDTLFAAGDVAPAPLRVTGWDSLPAILARIKAPKFPAREFPITNYGAKADNATECTDAIRQAIAACTAAGGGHVVVPAGTWLTGAIHLDNNVDLHLADGATLKFLTDPAKYPLVFTRYEGVECWNYSPLIYAFEKENIAVTGQGTLDGSASVDTWWAWTKRGPAGDQAKIRASRDLLVAQGESGVPVVERRFGPGHFLRPNFIQPYRCKNVLIEGVTINNSPMWEVHPVLSTNVTVRGLTIVTHGPNNDGCDPESCRDVLIENCLFDTGDDCIAIKSGRNNDGRRVNVPSENLVVRGCTMRDGHGGVVIGSEISGSCRNVFVENCTMDSPHLERALRFKSNARRGGVIENVFMRNVTVGRVAEAVLTIDLLYEEGPNGPEKPVVRNVALEHVTTRSSPRVMWIAGFPAATIDRVRFSDCTFNGIETAEVLQSAGTVTFTNVTITPAKTTRSLSSRPADAPSP